MREAQKIPPFVLEIEDVFVLADRTVLVGKIQSGTPTALVPCEVEVVVDGESAGKIRLVSERMPGPRSRGLHAVETREKLDIDALREGRIVLVHHGDPV